MLLRLTFVTRLHCCVCIRGEILQPLKSTTKCQGPHTCCGPRFALYAVTDWHHWAHQPARAPAAASVPEVGPGPWCWHWPSPLCVSVTGPCYCTSAWIWPSQPSVCTSLALVTTAAYSGPSHGSWKCHWAPQQPLQLLKTPFPPQHLPGTMQVLMLWTSVVYNWR